MKIDGPLCMHLLHVQNNKTWFSKRNPLGQQAEPDSRWECSKAPHTIIHTAWRDYQELAGKQWIDLDFFWLERGDSPVSSMSAGIGMKAAADI